MGIELCVSMHGPPLTPLCPSPTLMDDAPRFINTIKGVPLTVRAPSRPAVTRRSARSTKQDCRCKRGSSDSLKSLNIPLFFSSCPQLTILLTSSFVLPLPSSTVLGSLANPSLPPSFSFFSHTAYTAIETASTLAYPASTLL